MTGSGHNPILETYLSANAITVVSPSCTVLSGKNMNVDVGTIKRSDLNGVGTYAGGKDFNIELQCSGGLRVGICQYRDLFLRYSGDRHDPHRGALLNEKAGSSMPKGLGFRY
jgi:type 1 fimbria pilin